MPNDLALLLDRIGELVDEREDEGPEPKIETLEHTLTDGYAHALALEAESMRIEREIGEVVTRVVRGEETGVLRALGERLERTERDRARLRARLDVLRRRVDGMRVSGSDAASVRRDRFGPRTPPPEYGCRSAAS